MADTPPMDAETKAGVHTPGPLHVEQDEKWPYRLRIVTAEGETVHSEDMICHSSRWRDLGDARDLIGIHEPQRSEWQAVMDRQMADLRLRAAAPMLLNVLVNLHERIADAWPELFNLPPMQAARAAIQSATGGSHG